MDLELDFDPATVCRICLSSSNKLLNIFSSTVVDGYITAVPHMILRCLDIQVSTEDGLPDKVCSVCKSDIVNFFTFKEKSKRTESVLRTTLSPKVSAEQRPNDDCVVTAIKSERATAGPPSVAASSTPLPVVIEAEPKGNEAEAEDEEEEQPLVEEHNHEEQRLDEVSDTGTAQPDDEVALQFSCEFCGDPFDTVIRLKEHCDSTHAEVMAIERRNIKEEVIMSDDDETEERYDDVGVQQEVMADDDDAANNTELYAVENYSEIDQLEDFGDDSTSCFACHCDKTFSNANELRRHTKQHHNEEMEIDSDANSISSYVVDTIKYDSECFLCDMAFTDRDQFARHCDQLHEHFCEPCVILFGSEEELLWHNLNTHKTQQPAQLPPMKSKDVRSKSHASVPEFRCQHCDKHIRGQLKYDQHLKMHDSMNVLNNYVTFYPCHVCHLIFLAENDILEHRAVVHEVADAGKPANDQFVDTSCTDYQFLDEDGYDDSDYGCGVCAAVLPNAADAKYHLVSHSTVFTCPYEVCGCQYDNFGRYTSHIMNKHVNGTEHRCSHCGRQLGSFDELQAHMKNECVERKFACNHCDKKFYSSKALRLHERVIKGKTFMCQFCGKSFAQQGELTIHNRTHTGERPFACTVCGKQYKTSSMRTAHMDTHIPGKTFSCNICEKKLQTRTSYRNHMKRHTDDKKHECTYCGKMFFTKYHVKLHTMKVHEKGKTTFVDGGGDSEISRYDFAEPTA